MLGSGRYVALEIGPTQVQILSLIGFFDLSHHLLGEQVCDAVDEIE